MSSILDNILARLRGTNEDEQERQELEQIINETPEPLPGVSSVPSGQRPMSADKAPEGTIMMPNLGEPLVSPQAPRTMPSGERQFASNDPIRDRMNQISSGGLMGAFPQGEPVSEEPQRDIAESEKVDPLSFFAKNPRISDVINLGKSTVGSQEQLAAAQKEASDLRKMGRLQSAFDKIGAGLAQVRPSYGKEFEQSAEAQARQKIKDYEALVANEVNDPDSPASKAFRSFLKEFGYDVKGDLTAAVGKQIIPYAYQSFAAKEAQKARKEISAMNKEAKAEAKKTAQDIRAKERADKYIESSRKELSKRPEFEQINNAFSDLQLLRDAISDPSAARDVGTLYKFIKSFDPTSVVREGELKLAAGGEAFLDQFRNLTSRLSPNDTRLISPTFRKKMLETMEGIYQKAVPQYKNIVKQYKQTAIKSHDVPEERLAEIDPWHDVDMFSKLKLQGPEDDGVGKGDPKIQQYANKYFGGDYLKAEAVIKRRQQLMNQRGISEK